LRTAAHRFAANDADAQGKARMIAKEFLVELEKIRDSFDWKLVHDTHWQQERRSKPRLRIRGTCKNGPEGLFEPIGAVCFMLTGRLLTAEAWLEAATTIDLSLMDASDLISAANDRGWTDASDGRKPSEYVQRLRAKLMASVALVSTP
jgi:hypothetical protein